MSIVACPSSSCTAFSRPVSWPAATPRPLIISIDAKGNNLVDNNKALYNARKGAIVVEIGRQVRFIK